MNEEITYAEAQRELEEILDQLRQPDTSLDTLDKKVARAAELIQLCKERLHQTEARVETLFGSGDD